MIRSSRRSRHNRIIHYGLSHQHPFDWTAHQTHRLSLIEASTGGVSSQKQSPANNSFFVYAGLAVGTLVFVIWFVIGASVR